MKKTIIGFFSAACSAVILTGCCAFPEAMNTRGPHDEMVDENNRPFVQQHIKDYNARKAFVQPVIVKPNPTQVELLLSNRFLPQFTAECKRDILFAIGHELNNRLATRKDFRVINTEVENVDPKANVAEVYYTIKNMTANSEDRSYSLSDGRYVQNFCWNFSIELEVSLVKNGKVAFTIGAANAGSISNAKSLRILPLDNMKALIPAAIKDVVEQYDVRFGPPAYVVELIGNGKFAKLNIGAAYGFTRGRTVEFFHHSLKRVLDPATGEEKTQYVQVSLGTGTIGDSFCLGGCKVPEDAEYSWIYIPWNAKPQSNKVHVWTSARLIR